VAWSIDHSVLGRSATRWGSGGYNLPLLPFFVSANGVIHNDGIAHEFRESAPSVQCQMFLELGRQASHEAHILLGIGANLFWIILCQVVAQLEVVIHGSSTLLQIHELLVFPHHDACLYVLSTESLVELSPLHLVSEVSGDEVGPPCSSGA
jgi:hypothetical protein